MLQRYRIITPDDIQRILRGKYGTIVGGGIEQVNYIRNNGIRYRFVLKLGVDEYGAKFYSIIQNDDNEGSRVRCLHGEIDIKNKHRFIIMNITRHRGCGIPYEDSGFTKKMIVLIIRILKKREPEVNELEVMDNAGTRCSDGNGSINLSNLFMLKGELPFYMRLGFIPCTDVIKRRIEKNLKIVKGSIFKFTEFYDIIMKKYDRGDEEFDTYVENNSIELDNEEMPLIKAVKFLVDKHCIVFDRVIDDFVELYQITPVTGERFCMNI